MRQKLTAARFGLLFGLAAVIAVGAVQSAAGAGATVVRGDQFAGPNNCPNAQADTYRMAGDLIGCWYTDTANVDLVNPAGVVKVSGTEHFVGCLDANHNGSCSSDENGEFRTTFTFTSKYAATGDEIHGRCHHPIVGGSGVFEHASGELSFTDIPSEGRFPYHGPIHL